MVDASVEETGDGFFQPVGRFAEGGVMPYHDGLPVQSEGPQEDNQFQAPERSAVKHLVFFFAEKNFFGGIKHQFPSAGKGFVTVHHRVDAMAFQQGKTIENMSGKPEVFPLFVTFPCEASVIEINIEFWIHVSEINAICFCPATC